MSDKLRVFLTSPNMDRDATGEGFVAWRWAEALSHHVELTVFAFQIPNRTPLAEQLPNARAITTPIPQAFTRFPRFRAMAKPYYPRYMRDTRRVLARLKGEIDIAHQIMPQAARFPCPLYGQGVPYVLGPLGGALSTPEGFRSEAGSAAMFTRARAFDQMRFNGDPWLRRSYAGADLVLGVAPYMKDVLGAIQLQRFEPVLELGIADLPNMPERPARTDNLRLLHVGRGVRTKGLRDAVRAVGRLKDRLPNLRLDSAGAGEEIEICRAEAREMGIEDRVTFHGLIPRDQVEPLYADADIFVFPSFREPAGNVVYEAMRWGLPVITAARGGPDWIVDDKTGIRVPVTEPQQYADDIAEAIAGLAADPGRRHRMGIEGRAKLERDGLWPVKAARLAALYGEVLSDAPRTSPAQA